MNGEKYELNPAIGEADKKQVEALQDRVKQHLKLQKMMGIPIVRYDGKKKISYLEYPNGEKNYDIDTYLKNHQGLGTHDLES